MKEDIEYCFNAAGEKIEVSPSLKVVHGEAEVTKCSICSACINELLNMDTGNFSCKKLGAIPSEIEKMECFYCDYFEENRKSFYHKLVIKLMEEYNGKR